MRHLLVALTAGGMLLTGCTGGDAPDDVTSPSVTKTGSAGSSAPPTGTASGGTATDPATASATTDLLDWSAVAGSTDDTSTVSGEWTLTVNGARTLATLDGPDRRQIPSGKRGRITEALINGEYAVVVIGDRLEQRPATATVVDLADGTTSTIDGRSEVPTVNGGTWALGETTLLHATRQRSSYCLARTQLPDLTTVVVWCAPPNQGFNAARISSAGEAMLTFDDQHPSCRTVVTIHDGDVTPFPEVAKCTAWEGVLLSGGRIWSVIPNQRQVGEARIYASVGESFFDLGPGISGTLTACSGAAYFGRDPGRDGGPAQVLRWTPDGALSVIYESASGGNAVLGGPPRCGEDHLTVTALTDSGDVQVTALLR